MIREKNNDIPKGVHNNGIKGEKMEDIRRKDGESELSYIWRLCSAKDNGLLDMNWEQLGEVFNKEFREDETQYYSESAYRKRYQAAKEFYEDIFKDMQDDKYLKEIELERQELKKERYRLADERAALNKRLREDARLEDRLDRLEQELLVRGEEEYKVFPHIKIDDSGTDLLVLLGDLHIGQAFDSFLGKYNVDVAKDRLSKYLGEIKKITELHKATNCYVSLQGDLISGSIHKSVQVANSENVIEQIKIVSELLTSFVYNLSQMFQTVRVSSVSGNHSRLERKEDAMKDERMDDIPIWYMKAKLATIDNVEFEIEYDNTFATMDIRNKMYIHLHGDYDSFDKNGLSNLILMLGWIPDVVTYGHKHYPAYYYIGDTQIIQNGSLAGAGDDYTIEKRLSGKANQTVLVCTNQGVVAHYPVVLE